MYPKQSKGAESVPLLSESLPRLSGPEFERFQALIYREAGIFLSPVKTSLVAGRLTKRLRTLNLANFSAYFDLVRADEAERVRMLDCITTNETHFFRDQRQFRFLENVLFPRWRAEAESGKRARTVRAWSAACSTGEESCSIAMSMLEAFSEGWTLDVLGTDISTRVLARCQAGLYPIEKSGEIPREYLKRYMLKGVGDSARWMRTGEAIRRLVRFERMNLMDADYPMRGKFDLIFCCNVLIYFDATSKRHVVEQLARYLAPDGYIFFGRAESLSGITDAFQSVEPSIYRHARCRAFTATRDNDGISDQGARH